MLSPKLRPSNLMTPYNNQNPLSGLFGGGLLQGLKDRYQGSEFQQNLQEHGPLALSTFGNALSALGQGKSADFSGFIQHVQRKKEADERKRQLTGAMGTLTDPQRAVLGAIDPNAAANIVAGEVFKPEGQPNYDQYKVVDGKLVDMGAEGGPQVVVEGQEESASPVSVIGKINSDYQRGLISEVDRDAAIAKANKPSGPLVNNVNVTPAQKAVDTKYSKTYLDWTQGGKADAQKSVSQLKEVLIELESGKNLTGPLVAAQGKGVRSVTNPDSVAVQESVEEIVQRNLRLVLGAQFTEKEGQRLIERAYNPSLSEAENAKRLRRLIQQIETAAVAKDSQAQYYEQNGTLQGWTSGGSSATPSGGMGGDLSGISDAEILRQLGVQ